MGKKKKNSTLYHLPDKKSREFIVEKLIYTALFENASWLVNNSIRLTFILAGKMLCEIATNILYWYFFLRCFLIIRKPDVSREYHECWPKKFLQLMREILQIKKKNWAEFNKGDVTLLIIYLFCKWNFTKINHTHGNYLSWKIFKFLRNENLSIEYIKTWTNYP